MPRIGSITAFSTFITRSIAAGGFRLRHTLDNPDVAGGRPQDYFGFSVATSDNYYIVGALQEDFPGGFGSGKAYIFDAGTGTLLHTLNNPNPYGTEANDNFGHAVGITDTYAIVGAYPEDDAGGTSSGKAYIFNSVTGALVHTLDNPNAYNTSANDYFGDSVAISGNYAIVGAQLEDDAGGTSSGKAYIFNVSTGALVHTLDNPNAYNTSTNDQFSISVAISSNYAIVGAPLEDDAGGSVAGKAYVFNVSTGALVYTLNNPNAYGSSGGDRFGQAVGITDTYAIVGAFGEGDTGGTSSGKAYIFNASTGALLHTLNNPNAYGTSFNDDFGASVAISGNYAIVGAYEEDDANDNGSGKAYIFNASTGGLLYTLNNPNAYPDTTGQIQGDQFGYSVGISANYALVGAYFEDEPYGGTDSGKAYSFNVSTGALAHTMDNPNAYGGSLNDFFGYSVATSGYYAIVGAYQEDDSNTSSGKAYIFNNVTGALVHILDNPNAYNTTSNDNFGYSVGISANYAIVSAYLEDDAGGTSSGKAYIFNVSTGALVHTLNNPNAYGTSTGDTFGHAVAITDTYAIVTADSEDDASGTSSGKAYIFNTATGALVHTINNPNPVGTSASDFFGNSVAISGSYAIVGAYQENDTGDSSGKAYIYNVSTGNLVHTLNNPNAYNTSTNDRFGVSVGITDTYSIVGAYLEDDAGGTSSGKAYIFNTATGALIHTLNNPNAYNTSASDTFGDKVGITDTYAIVGAPQEDDAGGSASGKAYIFNVSTGALVHTLDNPNAFDTTAVDRFGDAVAITDNYAIVAAPLEDDAGGTSSGKAYIYIL